ncbi:YciI family protein [Nocardiopsis rhodophaea]
MDALKFALLIYQEEKAWAEAGPEERKAVYAAHEAFIQELAERGVACSGEELGPTSTARTVRRTNGACVTTDGPYAETTEQLGGFYLIDAADLDEAVRIAERLPAQVVEVRPIAAPPAA